MIVNNIKYLEKNYYISELKFFFKLTHDMAVYY